MSKKSMQKAKGHVKEQKEFEEEVLGIDRVTRVVKGGRRLRFRCTVAIGDKKGRVGVGTGKAAEVVDGIKKAVSQAKSSLIMVPITKDDTLPHPIRVKHKAAELLIMPASPGTGVLAGGSLRKILNLAGVKNVLSKSFGSRNALVTAQASMRALSSLRPVRDSMKKKDAATSGPLREEKSTPSARFTPRANSKKTAKPAAAQAVSAPADEVSSPRATESSESSEA